MNFLVILTIIVTVLGIAIDGCNCKTVQFIFGDSLSDVGNNKYLSRSLAQASLPWYGIDFGNGLPNGRFSNGRTVADIIGTYFMHMQSQLCGRSILCCKLDITNLNVYVFSATPFKILNDMTICIQLDLKIEILTMKWR